MICSWIVQIPTKMGIFLDLLLSNVPKSLLGQLWFLERFFIRLRVGGIN